MPRTIILTGGGTAGHITPNLALIPECCRTRVDGALRRQQAGMEKELAGSLPGVTYHGISSGKLRRYLDPKNLRTRSACWPARRRRCGSSARSGRSSIFSKGGFVSVPVAYAARLARVPMVLHESDLSPGLANRLATPSAARVCTTFPETAEKLGEKARYTGTPIRRALFGGSAAKGLALCGFEPAGLPGAAGDGREPGRCQRERRSPPHPAETAEKLSRHPHCRPRQRGRSAQGHAGLRAVRIRERRASGSFRGGAARRIARGCELDLRVPCARKAHAAHPFAAFGQPRRPDREREKFPETGLRLRARPGGHDGG